MRQRSNKTAIYKTLHGEQLTVFNKGPMPTAGRSAHAPMTRQKNNVDLRPALRDCMCNIYLRAGPVQIWTGQILFSYK